MAIAEIAALGSLLALGPLPIIIGLIIIVLVIAAVSSFSESTGPRKSDGILATIIALFGGGLLASKLGGSDDDDNSTSSSSGSAPVSEASRTISDTSNSIDELFNETQDINQNGGTDQEWNNLAEETLEAMEALVSGFELLDEVGEVEIENLREVIQRRKQELQQQKRLNEALRDSLGVLSSFPSDDFQRTKDDLEQIVENLDEILRVLRSEVDQIEQDERNLLEDVKENREVLRSFEQAIEDDQKLRELISIISSNENRLDEEHRELLRRGENLLEQDLEPRKQKLIQLENQFGEELEELEEEERIQKNLADQNQENIESLKQQWETNVREAKQKFSNEEFNQIKGQIERIGRELLEEQREIEEILEDLQQEREIVDQGESDTTEARDIEETSSSQARNRTTEINTGSENILGPSPMNPWTVSISDIHGYWGIALGMLETLEDFRSQNGTRFKPLIHEEDDGEVSLTNNNYQLVLNGEMIDRGPRSEEALSTAYRWAEGSDNVYFNMGNHEMAVILNQTNIGDYVARADTKEMLEKVEKGVITAISRPDQSEFVYVHAGKNSDFHANVNQNLANVAKELRICLEAGEEEYRNKKNQILDRCEIPNGDYVGQNLRFDHQEGRLAGPEILELFGIDASGGFKGRGKRAGIFWMDWRHWESGGPEQIVGHSKVASPEVKHGSVNCNTLRYNIKDPAAAPGGRADIEGPVQRDGGESIKVETSGESNLPKVFSLTRKKDNSVVMTDLIE